VSLAVMFVVGQSAGSRKFEKHGEKHEAESGATHEAGAKETPEKAGATAEP
jgi:hypothetical protein